MLDFARLLQRANQIFPGINHRRLVPLGAVVLAILVPFFTVGDRIEQWALAMLNKGTERPMLLTTVTIALLAADVLLPVPSSLVSMGASTMLGFVPGVIASALGMTISAMVAYGIGRFALGDRGRTPPTEDRGWLRILYQRHANWTVALTRPVPVLAEATAVFAGAGRMPFRSFASTACAANLGVALAYGAAGTKALATHSFWLLLVIGVLAILGPLLCLHVRATAGTR